VPSSLDEVTAQKPEDQEKEVALSAPVPTEGQAASLQLTEPEAAPGTVTSDGGASEAPVAAEVVQAWPTGYRETEEPTSDDDADASDDGADMESDTTETNDPAQVNTPEEHAVLEGLGKMRIAEESPKPPKPVKRVHLADEEYSTPVNGDETTDVPATPSESTITESTSLQPSCGVAGDDADGMEATTSDERSCSEQMDMDACETTASNSSVPDPEFTSETPQDLANEVDDNDTAADVTHDGNTDLPDETQQDSEMQADDNDHAVNASHVENALMSSENWSDDGSDFYLDEALGDPSQFVFYDDATMQPHGSNATLEDAYMDDGIDDDATIPSQGSNANSEDAYMDDGLDDDATIDHQVSNANSEDAYMDDSLDNDATIQPQPQSNNAKPEDVSMNDMFDFDAYDAPNEPPVVHNQQNSVSNVSSAPINPPLAGYATPSGVMPVNSGTGNTSNSSSFVFRMPSNVNFGQPMVQRTNDKPALQIPAQTMPSGNQSLGSNGNTSNFSFSMPSNLVFSQPTVPPMNNMAAVQTPAQMTPFAVQCNINNTISFDFTASSKMVFGQPPAQSAKSTPAVQTPAALRDPEIDPVFKRSSFRANGGSKKNVPEQPKPMNLSGSSIATNGAMPGIPAAAIEPTKQSSEDDDIWTAFEEFGKGPNVGSATTGPARDRSEEEAWANACKGVEKGPDGNAATIKSWSPASVKDDEVSFKAEQDQALAEIPTDDDMSGLESEQENSDPESSDEDDFDHEDSYQEIDDEDIRAALNAPDEDSTEPARPQIVQNAIESPFSSRSYTEDRQTQTVEKRFGMDQAQYPTSAPSFSASSTWNGKTPTPALQTGPNVSYSPLSAMRSTGNRQIPTLMPAHATSSSTFPPSSLRNSTGISQATSRPASYPTPGPAPNLYQQGNQTYQQGYQPTYRSTY
jgi:hypothetical protein